MQDRNVPAPVHDPDKDRLRRMGAKVRKRLAANKAVRRIAVDKAEIWAVGRFLDPIECGRLIAIVDAVAKPSKVLGYDYASGYRTSYSGDVDAADPFIRQLQQRLDDLLGIDPAFGETIQGQRYLPGQEFRAHVDWFAVNSPNWRQEQQHGGQRSITAMAYLNPVDEGGETDFPSLDIAFKPRAGTLLIWNNMDPDGVPNPFTFHAGAPVTRGAKYVVTKWYRTRPWV